jgi:hypothetical protein
MMNEELVKRLKDDSDFKDFQEYVWSEIEKLNSIDDLISKSNKEAGETVRVRAMASQLLEKILDPFISYQEKREPTAKEVDAVKKRVGL